MTVLLEEDTVAYIKERIAKATGDAAERLAAVQWSTPISDALGEAFGAHEHRVEHARHFVSEFIDEGQRNRRERRRARKAHDALLRMRTTPDRRSITSIIGNYARGLPRIEVRP